MNLKAIEIVLENCEVLKIDKEFIRQLQIGTTYFTYLWQDHLPSIDPNYFTNYCKIDFNENFTKEKIYKPNEAHNYEGQPTCWVRLTRGLDITSIVLLFDNDTEQQIYVPWKGLGINKNRAIKITDKYIEIDETILIKKIFNFFKRIIYNKIEMIICSRRHKRIIRSIKCT